MARANGPSVVLFGAGTVSMAHGASAGLNRMPIVAVASRTAEHASARAADLGSRAASYDDVLQRRVDADIAVVCTPPECHARDAISLLDAGYAVLVETPLCRTLAEADAMVEAAARRPGQLMYAENMAFAPVVRQLLPLVSGLGPVTHVEVRALQRPPARSTKTMAGWGGGALFDLGVHPLAIALLVANASGAGVPLSVRASLSSGPGGTDDHAVLHIAYGTGLEARVEASWRLDAAVQWDAQAASDTGVARAELLPLPQLEWNGEPVALPSPTAPVRQIEDLGYLAELRALAHDLDRATTPTMGATFGRLVLDVVCAAYRSAGRDSAPEMIPFAGPRDRTPLELWRGA